MPLGIGLLLVLLLFSALTSASEVAFFSLTQGKLDAAPDTPSRQKLVRLLDRPKNLLATILLLNNMANIGIIVISDDLLRDLEFSGLPPWLKFLVQVVSVTFVILLFGEVIPKVYARKMALRLSLFFVSAADLGVRLMRPVTWPLIRFSSLLDRNIRKRGRNISVEQLSDVLEMTGSSEVNAEDQKMLKGIVRFGSLDVTAIMTPRADVVMVRLDMDYAEVMQTVVEHGNSRIPVFRENGDQIMGILFIKDMIPHMNEPAGFAWNPLIREPFFVPRNKKIDDLLKEFQRKKMHMALVVDEFGGFEGLVTLEDVLEEVVGEINDEYDDDDVDYYKMNDSNYIFAGKTSVQDFLRILDFDRNFFDGFENEPESIAGVLLEVAGRIPARNETVGYKYLTFRILNADNRRINRVKVSIMSENSEPENGTKTNGVFSLAALFFVCTFLFSCGGGQELIPRPKGYYEVVFPEKAYRSYEGACPFTFEYPVYAGIAPFRRDPSKTCWFDVVFPAYSATLHMSYEDVSGNFADFSEDQHALAYKHTSKANAIEEIFVESPKDKIWGIVYDIEGDAASSYQFHVTDSQKHFLRGSLYFDFKANADSVAPVLSFLKQDVMHLVETVKWK